MFTADVTDRAGAVAMFDRRRDGLSQVQNVLVDGGYTGKPFATAVQSLLGAAVEVVKRSELHTLVVLPKRWVVERSFAWLEKCRRLWKNCERKLNTSLQMVVLAFMVLILKRSKTGSKQSSPSRSPVNPAPPERAAVCCPRTTPSKSRPAHLLIPRSGSNPICLYNRNELTFGPDDLIARPRPMTWGQHREMG